MYARSLIVVATMLALFVATSPALAQHVVTPADLHTVITEQRDAERASRDAVSKTLHRTEVQQTAARLGLDVTRADQVLSQLSGAELAQAAAAAQAVETDLAGGAQTVTISVTTLLIVLLVVLLIAND